MLERLRQTVKEKLPEQYSKDEVVSLLTSLKEKMPEETWAEIDEAIEKL